MSLDLLLRYVIITIAFHLACAWVQAFQKPWPLVDAFELADNAEEQLFKSLGIKFDACRHIILVVIERGSRASATLKPSGRSWTSEETYWLVERAY